MPRRNRIPVGSTYTPLYTPSHPFTMPRSEKSKALIVHGVFEAGLDGLLARYDTWPKRAPREDWRLGIAGCSR